MKGKPYRCYRVRIGMDCFTYRSGKSIICIYVWVIVCISVR